MALSLIHVLPSRGNPSSSKYPTIQNGFVPRLISGMCDDLKLPESFRESLQHSRAFASTLDGLDRQNLVLAFKNGLVSNKHEIVNANKKDLEVLVGANARLVHLVAISACVAFIDTEDSASRATVKNVLIVWFTFY